MAAQYVYNAVDALKAVAAQPLAPLTSRFGDPNANTFWLYLLSAMVVATWVSAPRYRRGNVLQRLRALVSHQESVAWRTLALDAKIYVLDSLIFQIVYVAVGGVSFACGAYFVSLVPATSMGGWMWPTLAVTAAWSVAALLAFDFGCYVAHYLMHKVPVLWIFHRGHHSAPSLNPLTGYRAHPIEMLVTFGVPAFFVGVVRGTFDRVFLTGYSELSIWGVSAVIFAFNLTKTLRHSDVWLEYPGALGYLFVSPAAHIIHHSVDAKHIDCNYGHVLAIWDHLFRTAYRPRGREELVIGLVPGDGVVPESLYAFYVEPFVEAAQAMRFMRRSARPTAQPGDAVASVDAAPRDAAVPESSELAAGL
jgi:sterol desaturase/sphingolipid hydroxylase (fatty acid hydroxylase superfamily)